jgi:hypothetical protein
MFVAKTRDDFDVVSRIFCFQQGASALGACLTSERTLRTNEDPMQKFK